MSRSRLSPMEELILLVLILAVVWRECWRHAGHHHLQGRVEP